MAWERGGGRDKQKKPYFCPYYKSLFIGIKI